MRKQTEVVTHQLPTRIRHGLEESQARADVSSLLDHLLEEQLVARAA